MVNQQKIIAMTKLALYDKHEGAADRAANDYFRHDYIYKKNFSTRISVGIGGFVILALYWLQVFFIEGVDIFDLNVQKHVTDAALFIVAIMAVYSLIGTIQGTREYFLVQKRLEKYNSILRFLENADERIKRAAEQAAAEKAAAELEDLPENERRARERAAEREKRARERREREREAPPVSLRDIDESSRRTYTREPEMKTDPLANVSARARETSRPRPTVPLTQRPPRPRTSARSTPVYRVPKLPEEK